MSIQRMMMTTDTSRQGRDIVFISSLRISSWKLLVFAVVKFEVEVTTSSTNCSNISSELEWDCGVFNMTEIFEDMEDDNSHQSSRLLQRTNSSEMWGPTCQSEICGLSDVIFFCYRTQTDLTDVELLTSNGRQSTLMIFVCLLRTFVVWDSQKTFVRPRTQIFTVRSIQLTSQIGY